MLSPVKIWRNQGNIASLAGITGKIVSWTIVRAPSCDFAGQAPFPVALVEIVKGRKICAQVVDWKESDLKVGQKVTTVVRRVVSQPDRGGVIPYGIKVKPV
ncbi:Zn-ribbon domain-containing OB-fold protein [Patescibacteria group bacterium]